MSVVGVLVGHMHVIPLLLKSLESALVELQLGC